MKYPKISIVIPLYEVFDFLSETISSCLSQDYPGEIEIILIVSIIKIYYTIFNENKLKVYV